MGLKNLSVMGGFDLYIKNNLHKALHNNEISDTQFNNAQKIISDYKTSAIPDRKKKLFELRKVLTGVKENTTLKPSKAVKTSIDIKIKSAQKMSLESDIQYAKGVGPQLSLKMKVLGINTIRDLLYYFPRRYEDRSNLTAIANTMDGAFETVKGRVHDKRELRLRKGLTATKVTIDDGTGFAVLTWFNQPYKSKSIPMGTFIYASGKVEKKFGETQIQNPEIELANEEENLHTARIVPVYPSTENLSQRTLRKIIKSAVENYSHLVSENLPEEIVLKYDFMPVQKTLQEIHYPSSAGEKVKAEARLIYEEFFLMQLAILSLRKNRTLQSRSHSYIIDKKLIEEFEANLPFKFTSAQKRVIYEILMELAGSYPMSRLVQGDVGSGKTIVAAAIIYVTVKSGYQGAIMAPTEILAEQHYKKFRQYLEPYGINVGLFTGSLTKKEREALKESLKTGEINVAVGTHALIQEGIEFKNLAFCVVDEQHKFGVMQRTELQKKGNNADLLVMTATPIPRTLSLILYGDLSISVIDELPPNRQEIKSFFRPLKKIDTVYSFIKEEIKKGRQAYIVCSLIDESDKIEAKAALAHAEELKSGIFSDIKVSVLHGKMKAQEKEEIMENFRKHGSDILISTTVIEVGVDVPNATVMVILNAERFGLAQLHQLRGRVGRGSEQSYCFFSGEIKSQESRNRLETMVSSSDGFVIAEKDLELRGPGDFCGTRQHGIPELKLADLIRDRKILEIARKDAENIIASNTDFVKKLKYNGEISNSESSGMIH